MTCVDLTTNQISFSINIEHLGVKDFPAGSDETQVQSLGREDLPKKEIARQDFLAWKIQWMEEPDRLQSMGLQRVRHD